MPTVVSFIFRGLLLVAGLLFALSLAMAVALMLTLWVLRAAWGRLTGQPVEPFVVHMPPGHGFANVYTRGHKSSRTPRADAIVPRGGVAADVVDVEPK
ncbi:MAG: hypothetical protein AB7U97_16810 [Pirellulales bacterium]